MHANMNRIELNDGKDYLVYREGSGDTIEIYDIAVMSKRQRGYGRKMVEMLEEKVDTHAIFAITRESNLIARTFYKKLGFKEAVLPKLYEKEDAVMYIKRCK